MSVTSQNTKERIRQAILRHHAHFKAKVLGTSPEDSLRRLAYLHSFLTPPNSTNIPNSLQEATKFLRENPESVPTGADTEEVLAENDSQLEIIIDTMAENTFAKVSSLITENNQAYHRNSLQHPTRSDLQDELMKESTLSDLGDRISDLTAPDTRKWRSIVLTGLSDAVGTASVDRIVDDHLKETGTLDAGKVFVFRVVVGDVVTCKFCRKFYGDVGQTPKVYRLSTLLGNGSNYGKKQASWLPVVGATHPNTRTSQIIEIPPGFIPSPGGALEFVGEATADIWIAENLTS